MKVTKAVVTAAGRKQRTLPLQTLVDRDGVEKSVLSIIIEEALRAGSEEICVVVCPGDEGAYADAAGSYANRLTFVPQNEPLGYGHAVYCAREFVDGEPFLHLVGDHLYVNASPTSCAQALVQLAEAQSCSISAVQPSHESLLPYYGCVGGKRVPGSRGVYEVEQVLEKPTPTEAEISLVVPGLRAGHYLCFFGMHVLTPGVMAVLEECIREAAPDQSVTLSDALDRLARKERYLALEVEGWRYDVGVKYGVLNAQLALALSGQDREEVLANLLHLLSVREMHQGGAHG
ncbi:MAG: UTP--glucose-1-phosphate uridylyltransferase [Chloroflexi bacterium]|jgi:UTP--glucose-1-phosphate uridylyltransferase|nr:UTP--glucose-1-phosphate uridylyltransferase [Chloroflexota bacterium]